MNKCKKLLLLSFFSFLSFDIQASNIQEEENLGKITKRTSHELEDSEAPKNKKIHLEKQLAGIVFSHEYLTEHIARYIDDHCSLFNFALASKNVMPFAEKLRRIYLAFQFENEDYTYNSPQEIVNEVMNKPVSLAFTYKFNRYNEMRDEDDETDEEGYYSGNEGYYPSELEFNNGERLSTLVPFLSEFQNIQTFSLAGYNYYQCNEFDNILIKNPIKNFRIEGIDEKHNYGAKFTTVFPKMLFLKNLTLKGYFSRDFIVSLYKLQDRTLERLTIDNKGYGIDGDAIDSNEVVAYMLLIGKVKEIKGILDLLIDTKAGGVDKEIRKELQSKGTKFL